MSTPLHASCLCEDIQYTVHGEPENVVVCYCSDCSKNAGAPYQILARYDKSSIRIVKGQELVGVWVVSKTTSGVEKHKEFCKRCGCTLWTKPMSLKGEKIVVRTSLIDGGLEKLKPRMELWTKLRPDFLEPFEGTEQFETMPAH